MAPKLHVVGAAPSASSAPVPLDFAQLYDEHFGFTWRVLRHLGLTDSALNDACQDVWLVVHRQLATLELRADPRSWLFGIAANVARNHRRALRRRGEPHELSPGLAWPGPDPEASHLLQESWRLVQRFLERLGEFDRCIFVCNVIEHLSALETASALETDVAVVYQRVRVLKRAARKWLEREAPDV